MPFIRVIAPKQATGTLADLYSKVSGPGGQVDNVLQIHSLRPHTLNGHMALYKAVLHHPQNRLHTWFLESIGVLVSLLNDCSYCAKHHAVGMKRHMPKEQEKFDACLAQLSTREPGKPFTKAEQAALAYARKLTLQPGSIEDSDFKDMRRFGFSDGQILEVNQVASYFAYANRTVTGLGVHTEGETLGLAPEKTDDWHHS